MLYYKRFIDQQSAKLEIYGYMEGSYNNRQLHPIVGYKIPKQMEKMLLEKEKLAA